MNERVCLIPCKESSFSLLSVPLVHWAMIIVCLGTVPSAGVCGAKTRPVEPSCRPAPPDHSATAEQAEWTQRYFVDDAEPLQPSAEEANLYIGRGEHGSPPYIYGYLGKLNPSIPSVAAIGPVGDGVEDMEVHALAHDGRTLYMTHGFRTNTGLWKLDTTDASYTLIGYFDMPWGVGLAYDYDEDVLWVGSSDTEFPTRPRIPGIARLDRSDGSIIGDIVPLSPKTIKVDGMAYGNGTLYGLEETGEVYSIDTSTGVTKQIAKVDTYIGHGLAWDEATQLLYVGSSIKYLWSVSTDGKVTYLGQIKGGHASRVHGMAPAPEGLTKVRSFMLYSRPNLSLVFDNSVPHGDDKAEKLTCIASPGEYESMTLAIYALRELDSVSVKVNGLQKQKPGWDKVHWIPASQIEVRVARSQHKRIAERPIYKGPPPKNEFMYMPSWLFVEEKIDMHARQSAWFWITVHVPDDADPGTYRGYLTVCVGEQEEAVLPIEVEVLPIRLRELSTYAIGYYFRTNSLEPSRSVEERMADMRAYGMTSVHILLEKAKFPKIRLDNQGKVQVDIAGSNFDRALEAYKNCGYPAPPVMSLSGKIWTQLLNLGFDADSQAYKDAYLEVLGALKSECDWRGWPSPILSPLDEAVSHAASPTFGLVPLHLNLMKQAGFSTELNHFLAYPSSRTTQWRNECLPFLDVINLIYSTSKTPQGQPPWRDCVNLARGNGKTLWIYNALMPGSVQPTSWRFMSGWFFRTWGKDVKGSFYYCFDNAAGDPDKAWHPPDPKTGQAGGPSIDIAGAREGIDDLRYIVTLERLILKARSHNADKTAAEAEQILKEIIDSFDFSNAPHIKIPNATAESEWVVQGERDGLPTASGEYLYRNGWGPTDYDRAREKVAREIVKMQTYFATEFR